MKKLLAVGMLFFSSAVMAGGSISGYINVSVTILPNSNHCSNEMCGMNNELLQDEMVNKQTISTSDFIATKSDDMITVFY